MTSENDKPATASPTDISRHQLESYVREAMDKDELEAASKAIREFAKDANRLVGHSLSDEQQNKRAKIAYAMELMAKWFDKLAQVS